MRAFAHADDGAARRLQRPPTPRSAAQRPRVRGQHSVHSPWAGLQMLPIHQGTGGAAFRRQQLAAELKERGLPVSGRKAELVARLEEGE